MMKNTRTLSPYEQNHLRRHGIDPETIDQYGDMPVEYITGRAEFYRREFVVNARVLIPRVEEKDLIRLALEITTGHSERSEESSGSASLDASTQRNVGTQHDVTTFVSGRKQRTIAIADVGTGCGILGITLYLELQARGAKPVAYLSDISRDTLRVAKQNVDRLVPKPHRVHLLRSDLLYGYPPHVQFDLLVANLPYIPSDRIASLPPSVRDYEPLAALDGGKQGLEVINKFLAQADQYSKKDGLIVIEIDESHRLDQMYIPRRYTVEVHQDQFGKNRYLTFRTQKQYDRL